MACTQKIQLHFNALFANVSALDARLRQNFTLPIYLCDQITEFFSQDNDKDNVVMLSGIWWARQVKPPQMQSMSFERMTNYQLKSFWQCMGQTTHCQSRSYNQATSFIKRDQSAYQAIGPRCDQAIVKLRTFVL